MYNVTLSRLRLNNVYRGKIIMYSECVAVAKIIHHAKRVNGIILLFLACLALHFPA